MSERIDWASRSTFPCNELAPKTSVEYVKPSRENPCKSPMKVGESLRGVGVVSMMTIEIGINSRCLFLSAAPASDMFELPFSKDFESIILVE